MSVIANLFSELTKRFYILHTMVYGKWKNLIQLLLGPVITA